MATAPITPEPRRFSIRLPRPLWIGVAAMVVVGGVGLRIGLPIYWQQAAIREIKRMRDLKLPMDARKAIAIAMSYFADENRGQPIDAEYWTTCDSDGIHVVVSFVVERDFIGRPKFMPGGHCTVNISKEGKVRDVVGGP